MSMGLPASTAVGFAKDFFTYFRTSRSPYLFVGVVCIFSIVIISSSPANNLQFTFAFVPIGVIYLVLVVLTFSFRPYVVINSDKLNDADLQDIDDQFKFSRASCLSVGVICLTFLFKERFAHFSNTDIIFWVSYVCCLVHILVFTIYVIFKNIREDGSNNIPIFQIGLFTAVTLIGLTYLSTTTSYGGLFDKCSYNVEYKSDDDAQITRFECGDLGRESARELENRLSTEGVVFKSSQVFKIENQKISYWYLVCIFIFLEIFWIRRLRRISTLKFLIRISDE